jgi:hypothetical protein
MTDRPSAEAVIRDALHRLRVDLDGHHHVVDLSEHGEQRIRSAIEWLLAVRHPDGYWGYRSPAVTATCTQAIALWRPVEAEALLRPSAEWLLSQAHGGAWETTWDSGAALAAVCAAGLNRDPRAQEAMTALARLAPAAVEGCPHHGAQVLNAALLCEWPPPRLQRWADSLIQELDPRFGPYVLGQATYGLLSVGRPVADLHDTLDHLAEYLTDTPPSTAAFLDHTSALRALARAGTHPEVVDRSIDNMFSGAHRRDGSWYHEPWYTAWALLALNEANSVRRVVVEQPRLDDYLARADQAVGTVRDLEANAARAQQRSRFVVMTGTVLLVVGIASVLLAVFALPDTNRLFSSGLAVSLVLGVIAVAWRLLWPALTDVS